MAFNKIEVSGRFSHSSTLASPTQFITMSGLIEVIAAFRFERSVTSTFNKSTLWFLLLKKVP